MKLIHETTNEEELRGPPVYFMDSYVEDDNSKENLRQLISLTKSINQPIENIRQNCSLKFKKKETETETRTESVCTGDQIITYIKKYKRTKFIDYNNNETYSNWECIDTRTSYRDIPVKKKSDDSDYKSIQDIYEKARQIKSNDTNKGNTRTGYGNHEEGICDDQKFPQITVINYICEMNGQNFKRVEKEFNEYIPSLIVGFKIEDNWKDGTNGSWEINDALLSHNLKAKFVSQLFRGQSYNLKVYTIDMVKKDLDDSGM